jgi:hypothetical protein
MQYPTNSDYESAVRTAGANFNQLSRFEFIPSRTVPIRIFMHGSGSFAVIFKATDGQRNFAIRCFTNASKEKLDRYKNISNYLKSKSLPWEVEFDYYDQEIKINGISYPLLKMNWVNGVLLNDYIGANLQNKKQLEILQNKIAELSISLEENEIGHGDIQSLNILVIGRDTDIGLKLVDYDGMYVPDLKGRQAVELGKPDFQHPVRNECDFDEKMDRFSFWVLLTGIEALKNDANLWSNISHGGFNTSDNILFTPTDFINPDDSRLFKKLKLISSNRLQKLVQRLISFTRYSDLKHIESPGLFFKQIDKTTEGVISDQIIRNDIGNSIKIFSDSVTVNVYNPLLKLIGVLPFKVMLPAASDLVLVENNQIIRIPCTEINNSIGDIKVDFQQNKFIVVPKTENNLEVSNFNLPTVSNKINLQDEVFVEKNHTARLNINTKPEFAYVYINDKEIGKSRLTFETKIGEILNVKVEKQGYKTKTFTQTVINNDTSICIDLEQEVITLRKVGYTINILNGNNPEIVINGISHSGNYFSSESIPFERIDLIINCKGYDSLQTSFQINMNESQNDYNISLKKNYSRFILFIYLALAIIVGSGLLYKYNMSFSQQNNEKGKVAEEKRIQDSIELAWRYADSLAVLEATILLPDESNSIENIQGDISLKEIQEEIPIDINSENEVANVEFNESGYINHKKGVEGQLEIGDFYQGGIIFYLNDGKGLIASQNDIGVMNWEDAKIVGGVKGINSYFDWYLPSYLELRIIYENRNVIGGFEKEYYWSSTPHFNQSMAWSLNFFDGNKEQANRLSIFNVRLIREFEY